MAGLSFRRLARIIQEKQMPIDSKGKYQMNHQKVRRANAMHAGGGDKPVSAPDHATSMGSPTKADMGEDAPHMKVYDHGDGTGHTETADGGYHDHKNIEGLKEAFNRYMDEEASEGGGESKEAAHQGDWA